MPSKSYSKEKREEVRQCLLETALNLYAKHGIKKVSLMDILTPVGISKPFFYTFFDSVQIFIIAVLDFQWTRITALIETLKRQSQWSWEEQATELLHRLIHSSQYGLLIMTQDEEMWVRSKLSDDEYTSFMENQVRFFSVLLEWWGISEDICPPKVLGNLVISISVIYNSAERSLPFLYLDALEETAYAQAESIVAYLRNL